MVTTTAKLTTLQNDTDSESCIVCKSESDVSKKIRLTLKGSNGVNEASERRGRSLVSKPGQYIHEHCRKRYCHLKYIKSDQQQNGTQPENESKTLRSSADSFDFKDKCLFCGQRAKLFGNKRGNDVFPVRTLDFQKSIEKICTERSDNWANAISVRLKTIHDLPAADALYHQRCSVNFRTMRDMPTRPSLFSPTSPASEKKRKGRPLHPSIEKAFMEVVRHLQENENKQIPVTELVEHMREKCGDDAFSVVHMKQKLKEHFDDSVIITEVRGKCNIVTLVKTAASILHDFYQNQIDTNNDEKSALIIKTAAKLIKHEIKTSDNQTVEYPSPLDILSVEKNKNYLPKNLCLLLEALFLDKISLPNNVCIKVASIGQAIMQAVKQRVIIPPLQLGLGILLHHHFASRFLIDTLNKLGFCSSYSEIQKFESCASVSQGTDIRGYDQDKFIQYVADNVDHNSRTLDGHGTFHGMGIIACVTPDAFTNDTVKRTNVEKEQIINAGEIKCSFYKAQTTMKHKLTLKEIQAIKATNKTKKLDTLIKLTSPLTPKRPSWSGLMQMLQKGDSPGVSSITFLPMIDMDPNDMSSVYTTLKFIEDHASKYSITPVVTFDQPLYWKAMSIILHEPSNSPLQKVVLRLGGFHTIMSFLGCIGHLMQGSGLGEVLENVYAPNAVVHMLTGKAVARALRGHFLVENALMMLLVSSIFDVSIESIFEDETSDKQDETDSGVTKMDEDKTCPVSELSELFSDIMEEKRDVDEIENSSLLQNASDLLDRGKNDLKSNSRTSALWLQYLEMVKILQTFIAAERTGDWELHLSSLSSMLPYFAAAGHNLYLKSAYVYLQCMNELKETHREVYEKFLLGHHVIRRSDRFWGGLSTDLVIEQVLMRSIKTTGGLTRGRGITEYQRAQWLLSLPTCGEYSRHMQEFCGVMYHTSEQHKDCSEARQVKDAQDTKSIVMFLKERNPFSENKELKSIETGVEAEEQVNVELSEEIGQKILKSMVGRNILEHTFKRSHQAVVLNTKPSIRIPGEECIQVDPQLLFQRLVTAAQRQEEDLALVFSYELSSVPSSLFDSSGFPRQPQKASLADAIWSLGDCSGEDNVTEVQYVLDGGSLLHHFPWTQGTTFNQICDMYVEHVCRQYSRPVVVFDGYTSGPTIKDVAHVKRNHGITGTKVHFSGSTPFKGKKELFLSNSENKQNFIDLLGEKLSEKCKVLHARDDADVLIAKTTVECAKTNRTILIGEDTDLLVLLLYHATLHDSDILFKTGSKSRCHKIWDIKKTKCVLGEMVCQNLPFLHAFTGCDSVSKIQCVGKGMALKRLIRDDALKGYASTFISLNDKKPIQEAGEKALSILLGGNEFEGLDLFRFRKFARKVSIGVSCVQVHSIPPTSAAAKYHSMRAYYQVQCWTNEQCNLIPAEWGWLEKNQKLYPVKTDLPPAPENLLRVIKCNCRINCDTKRCSCRKHGLECSMWCGECRGTQCSNMSLNSSQDEDIELQ